MSASLDSNTHTGVLGASAAQLLTASQHSPAAHAGRSSSKHTMPQLQCIACNTHTGCMFCFTTLSCYLSNAHAHRNTATHLHDALVVLLAGQLCHCCEVVIVERLQVIQLRRVHLSTCTQQQQQRNKRRMSTGTACEVVRCAGLLRVLLLLKLTACDPEG